MVFLEVAVLGAHVNHRRRPAIVTRRERTFVKRHFLDCLGREYGEETKQMVDFIDRRTVQEDKVFVAVAAAHVERTCAARALLHAGSHLYGAHQVGLAEERGSVFNHLDGDVEAAHTSGRDARLGFFAHDHHFFQLVVAREKHVDYGVFREVEIVLLRRVAHIRVTQLDIALWQRDGIKTKFVGDSPLRGAGVEDCCAEDSLLGLRIIDVAANSGSFLRIDGADTQRNSRNRQDSF